MAGKFSAFSLILFTLPNCSFKGGKIQKMETSVFQQKYQKEGPFLFPNGSWHCHFHSPLKQPKQRIHRVEERYFQTWATSLICIHNAFLFPIIIVAKLALHANEQLVCVWKTPENSLKILQCIKTSYEMQGTQWT